MVSDRTAVTRIRRAPTARARLTLGDASPGLRDQWHPERNGDLDPADIRVGSERRVWWRCTKGHEWEASVGSRSRGAECPFCSGRLATPERNLAVFFPDLAAEWHSDRNGGVRPTEVLPMSNRLAWWRGPCGHEWEVGVRVRTRGLGGCPHCDAVAVQSGPRGVVPARGSLAHHFPQVIAEWHPTRNGTPTRTDLMAKGTTPVWWLCQRCGAEWRATVRAHSAGGGCPACGGAQRDRIAQGVRDELRSFTRVGDRDDLPAPLRAWHPDGPDLVLPRLRLAVDILDAQVDLVDGDHDTVEADRSHYTAVGWRLLVLRAVPSDRAVVDGPQPVVFTLDDVPAAVTSICRYLSTPWVHKLAEGAAPAP